MARQPVCNHPRCTTSAVVHVEYRRSGTHVKNHYCIAHGASEKAAFERAWGVTCTTRGLDRLCREGRC